MKKSICLTYLPLFILGIVLATASCKKDDDTPDRDKFIGTYSVTESCSSGNDAYDITIATSGTADNAVTVSNLYDFGDQLSATVSGSSITIPSQQASGLTYSGTGTISGNTLTINFTISDGANTDTCTATCARK